MPGEEKSQPASSGEKPTRQCVDCGSRATVNVDQYGMPSQDYRCRDCFELHCSRVYREAAHARM
jgi:hypothetical protein